jgi:hypothetical protein
VKTVKAPQATASRNAVSIPALVLLGALSGSAIAATDIQAPCPEPADSAHMLHTFIAGSDSSAPLVRTVEATEAAVSARAADAADENASDADETETTPAADAATPAYSTRLPGVSANDMPGFRRHMYRTDI